MNGIRKLTDKELNAASNQINDINLDIKLFLKKFQEFKKKKIVDRNLYLNLITLYDEINEYIESEPTNIEINNEFFVNNDIEAIGIVRLYACDTCNSPIGTEARDISVHINQNKHKKMEEKYKNEKPNIKNVEGKKSGAAADEQAIKNGQNKRVRRNSRRQSNFRECRKIPKKAKKFLESNLEVFFDVNVSTAEKLQDTAIYEEIKQSILKSVKPIYSDTHVHLFGSRITGLGNLDSDLDIFLEIGDVFNLYNVHQKQIINKLNSVTTSLKKNKEEWNNFVVISDARVPILKAFNKKHRIDCDIGFSNSLGIMNTKLTKYLFELQPICRKMCLFIKKWLSVTTLKLQFSTYTFVMMTIFFLQTKNAIPTIKQLQDGIKVPFEIGPWQSDFSTGKKLRDFQIDVINDNNKKCLEFLIEFFDYYKKINFDAFVLSPYCGKLIRKVDFNDGAITEFPRYQEYYKLNPIENSIKLKTPMCVQDPFELNHNIAKGISGGILDLMKEYCQVTVKMLSLYSQKE